MIMLAQVSEYGEYGTRNGYATSMLCTSHEKVGQVMDSRHVSDMYVCMYVCTSNRNFSSILLINYAPLRADRN